jgi:xylulokinase
LVVAHQETGGACLAWLRDHIGGDRDLDTLLQLGAQAPAGSAGLHFLPWLNGEYAPVDDPFVRGGFVNLSFEHNLGHMVRAVLEGVAYNVQWALQGVESLSGTCGDTLRVGGGAAQSELWCQTLADVLGRTVLKPKAPGFGVAQGAAFIAAVGLGELPSFDAVPALVDIEARFTPAPVTRALHNTRYEQLRSFYKTNRRWFRRMNRLK